MEPLLEAVKQEMPEKQNKALMQEAATKMGAPAKPEAYQKAADATKAEASPRKAPKKSFMQRPSIWKDLLFLLIKIASMALAFVLLFTFLFGIMRYQEPSMSPAIKDGDLVLYYRYNSVGYMPKDVIALEYKGKPQARRVVATAGDTVDIIDGRLVINGAPQQEPEIYQKTERYEEGVDFPLTVPEGQVFVLGDSRTGAADSRIYGCVKIKNTLGKVMTVIRRRGI